MRRMYSKEQLQKLIDEVSRLIAIEELDKVVPLPALDKAGYVITVNAAGTGYELKNVSGVVDGATIRPANIYATNEITANSITENMSGYSYSTSSTDEHFEKEYVYVGVVKNGNKLTFVVAMNITRLDATNSTGLGKLLIPASIGAKLYPTRVGSYDFLDNKVLNAFDEFNSSKEIKAYVSKDLNTQLNIDLTGLSELVANTKYYVRYEVTFLLSDNLIPQE